MWCHENGNGKGNGHGTGTGHGNDHGDVTEWSCHCNGTVTQLSRDGHGGVTANLSRSR